MNCVETASGRYRSSSDTGTSPTNPDTDGDGIDDGDELLVHASGLNLRAMGANPLRKTIFVEHDWIGSNSSCSTGHRPSAQALALAVTMFANAPVANPDGSNGITLINDYGQGGLFTGGNSIADTDGLIEGNVFGSDFQTRKTQYLASTRFGYFHYAIHADEYGPSNQSSGYAEIIGDDLIVSMDCQTFTSWVGNTFAHELGHNLGLQHGGDSACNWKPNYNSVMNYRYQFNGVDVNCDAVADGVAGFSRGLRRVLNETSINEQLGVCTTAERSTPLGIDFSGDGSFSTNISTDVQKWYRGRPYPEEVLECGGLISTLTDHNDWQNLEFAGPSVEGAGLSPLWNSAMQSLIQPCAKVPGL